MTGLLQRLIMTVSLQKCRIALFLQLIVTIDADLDETYMTSIRHSKF